LARLGAQHAREMMRGFALQNGAAVLKLLDKESSAHRALVYHLQEARNGIALVAQASACMVFGGGVGEKAMHFFLEQK
jgi:hypothetical protein